jgi:hypothetical protein
MHEKNIGSANLWGMTGKTPLEYLAHEQAVKAGEKHDVKRETIGRCLRRMTCKTCGITWQIDSGD